MFSGFMVNAWIVASIVAVVAGVVGFFVVLRGSAFVAHAIPNGAFAGAAGAVLVGVDTIVGLGVFSLLGALAIGLLGRRGRHDAVTALALVTMLGLGALFLSLSSEYEPAVYSLLFGEVLGISPTELAPTAALAVVCVLVVAVIYRPLMLSSVLGEVGEARGIDRWRMELAFLAVVALATTMTVPVVGTLLIFSLMIGSPAAARSFTDRPERALLLSVALALATVWSAIALSYTTNYPIGFFVGSASAVLYAIGRLWAAVMRRRSPQSRSTEASHPTHPPERHTILT
ncbi:MAG TPA: metal ABC transporter permease [Solirubrobacteraceae bacterium]|jgi:zinc/manganese transport system permease protein